MPFESLSNQFTYVSLEIYGLMMGIEAVLAYFKGNQNYRFKDTSLNLITGLFALYLPYLAGLAILQLFYKLFHPYALFNLPSAWVDAINLGQIHGWLFLFLILGDDLSYYIYHRVSHISRFLWCIHEVHHSSEEYNFSVYFRASFLEYVFQGFFWIPMILVGFHIEDLIFQMSVNLFFQFWLHTRFTKSIPILDRIFNVPRYHRVHHAKNVRYLDRNFGAIFIFWDKLFGTFEEEREAPEFGVLSPPKSQHPVTVNLHCFQALYRDILQCKAGIKARLSYLFRAPGWRHDGTGVTTADLQSQLSYH